MTAAGQAMVVLVPIREKSAMTYINDTDAQLMGIVDEEKERLGEVDKNIKKEQERKASDLAELREARRELRKTRAEKGAGARSEAAVKSLKPEKGAPAIPSFMKVKSSVKAAPAATPEGESSPPPAIDEPEAKRPRTEVAEASGLGLGGYASDSDDEDEDGDDEAA
eukprot:Skav225093  [mRNA]  locus=scaffold621:139044:149554:+ [translate_table: standard]